MSQAGQRLNRLDRAAAPPAAPAVAAAAPASTVPPASIVPAAPTAAAAPLTGLAAVAGPGTRLLVLGSFPGLASLAAQQYYAHPRNQFWPILGALWGIDLQAMPYPLRLAVMQAHGLGLWDVYASCQRSGSLDSAISAARPNPLAALAATLPQLAAIVHNGAESARSAKASAALGLPAYRLPSTSPANASWTFQRKADAWGAVLAAHGLLAGA